MNEHEIHRGTQLAPGEAIVWRGAPSWRGMARDIFHLRAVTLYFGGLFVLDAGQAWAKKLPVAQALHDSVPLFAIAVVALGILSAFAWFTGRTTRYVVTDRRVILHYGVAMPAVLSLPYAQIVTASVAVNRDHTGDIALKLKAGTRMPYLKLWPLARAWHVTEPQPMLRGVPQVAVVGSLLARAVQIAEGKRQAVPAAAAQQAAISEVPAEELMSA